MLFEDMKKRLPFFNLDWRYSILLEEKYHIATNNFIKEFKFDHIFTTSTNLLVDHLEYDYGIFPMIASIADELISINRLISKIKYTPNFVI